MRKHISLTLLLFPLLYAPLTAQPQYRSDTLDFASFLNLCQDFSRSNRQEIWVVTFWASWNSNSLYQLPALKATYFNFQQKPVRFFFLSRDRDPSIWKNTMAREQLPGTHVLLSQVEDYEYLKQGFQHNSLPSSFLVDPQGNIYRVERVQQLQDMLAEQTRNLPDMFTSNDPFSGGTSNPSRPSTPAPQRPTPAAPSGDAGSFQDGFLIHTVRRTETLYSISRQYGVDVAELQRLNSLNGNLIKVGQPLRIKRQ